MSLSGIAALPRGGRLGALWKPPASAGRAAGPGVAGGRARPSRLAVAGLFGWGGGSKTEGLKDELKELVQGTNVGASASPVARELVDSICTSLAAQTPIRRPTAGAVAGRWRLIYTTERDVHVLAGLPTREISQEIDLDGSLVTNRVLYRLPLGLEATAPCQVAGPRRIEYAFDRFVLTVAGLELSIPPRGKGWSDTVYLDDDLRVVRNSRGDLLVLERADGGGEGGEA